MSTWMLLLHVASAFVFVAGLVGRDVSLARARKTNDIRLVSTLTDLAGVFDRLMVVPGSLAVLALGLATVWSQHLSLTSIGNRWLLVSLGLYLSLALLIPLVFLPRGRIFDRAMSAAQGAGHVTPELTAAFNDPVVIATRTYERIVVATIIILMVTKPF